MSISFGTRTLFKLILLCVECCMKLNFVDLKTNLYEQTIIFGKQIDNSIPIDLKQWSQFSNCGVLMCLHLPNHRPMGRLLNTCEMKWKMVHLFKFNKIVYQMECSVNWHFSYFEYIKHIYSNKCKSYAKTFFFISPAFHTNNTY